MGHQILSTAAWKAFRAGLIAEWRAAPEVRCHLCLRSIPVGQTISVDHLVPLSRRPDLAFDRRNVLPSHIRCNSAKKDRTR